MEKIKAYIDSFSELTILVDKQINKPNTTFYLLDGRERKRLTILNGYEEEMHYKYIVNNPNVKLNKEYYISDNYGNKGLLRSGAVVRDPLYDSMFSYDGPLGVEYSKNKTTFRLWTPVAKEIYVELINGDNKERYSLTYKDRGLWEVSIYKDIECYGYLYYVRIFEDFKCILDPYAISSSANRKMNYVIDPNKLYKMKYKKPSFSGKYTDAIIYEASVRDFTYDLKSENKSTFLGLVENNPTKANNPTGLAYIASLGVTHIQLLPIFDFGGVDDVSKNSKYNWGYNPEQYSVPSGWYSKNPNDPYSRINELLELIDNCHKYGLRVNMDVVFNHVYDFKVFPLDYLNPGYNYRVDTSGKMSNASYCGNDFASERYMCSRLICDALDYYVKCYNVDGFRFDLMGLLDVDTMNTAYNRLIKLEPQIMLYGEGWNMNNPLPNEFRAHMFNYYKIPEYAFFNDKFRDFIRGNQFDGTGGFVFAKKDSKFDLYHLLLGSCFEYYKFKSPTQSLNYVECHDNYTMFDYAKTYLGLKDEEAFDSSRLALELVLISNGIPFIHAGEEFYRTKQGVENSYNTKDSINKIDYARRDKYISLVNTVKDLIKIRKEYPFFRLDDAAAIKGSVSYLDGIAREDVFAYHIGYNEQELFIIVKNSNREDCLALDDDNELIFDGFKSCSVKDEADISKMGVYIIKKL